MDAKTWLAASLGLFALGCGASRQETQTARAGQATCPAQCPCHPGVSGEGTGMQGGMAAGQPMGQGRGMHGRGMGQGMGAETCPAGIPNTNVRAEETASGPALVFTTDADHVDALRARVSEMAERHNQQRASGEPAPGMRGAMHPNMRAAEARAEPTADGARLVFVPTTGSDVDALRSEVESQASFAGGQCPMRAPTSS